MSTAAAQIIAALRRDEQPIKQIAAEVGLHENSVRRIIQEAGYRSMQVTAEERTELLNKRREADAATRFRAARVNRAA